MRFSLLDLGTNNTYEGISFTSLSYKLIVLLHYLVKVRTPKNVILQ